MCRKSRWIGRISLLYVLSGCVGGGSSPDAPGASPTMPGTSTNDRSSGAGPGKGTTSGQAGTQSAKPGTHGSGSGGHAGGNMAGSGGTSAGGAAGANMMGSDAGNASSSDAGTADGGGTTTTMDAPVAGAKGSHFPLVDGAQWLYHHTKPATPAWDETDTVTATTYMGKPAFVYEDEEDAQGVQTHSTLLADGTGVYRVYKELTVSSQTVLTVTYDPAFLRFDESWTQKGQTVSLTDNWTQNCVLGGTAASNCTAGTMKDGMTTHEFTVVSASEMVTVAAGTFDTIEIRRVDPSTQETKLFWFAAGVGKVREENPDTMAVEELTSYQIP